MRIVFGVLLPFFGTMFGAAFVFFMKKSLDKRVENILLGFASGVMIAASIWSLLIPSISMAEEQQILSWLPASVGFLVGIFFLLLLDKVIPHLHPHCNAPEGTPSKLKKTTMLVLAVTLHNLPEGMAVGVILAAYLAGHAGISFSVAFALALGIAIQNIPEGAIISMPLKEEGFSKGKAFLYGVFSGIVEPIGAVLTLLLTRFVLPVLPYILSFAAGAMIYVVVEELIPESQEGKHSDLATVGLALGFVLMMILDIALG